MTYQKEVSPPLWPGPAYDFPRYIALPAQGWLGASAANLPLATRSAPIASGEPF